MLATGRLCPRHGVRGIVRATEEKPPAASHLVSQVGERLHGWIDAATGLRSWKGASSRAGVWSAEDLQISR